MTEGPYKLPEGWRWVRLGEVASTIKSGFAFRKKNTHGGDVLHLRPYNIGDDGQLLLDQQFLIPRTALPPNWSSLKPGDVLFNNTNSVELIGKTALVRDEMEAAFSNHITLIRVNPALCEGSWLMLSLNALWRKGFFAQQCNKWIGQAGYNIEMLRNTTIPLPPLSEQRRIVARVEELMSRVREAKRLRQQAKEDADRLWQSVLAEAFPRPGDEPPPDWRWVRLGEVCEIIMGQSPPSTTYNTEGEGLPFFQGKADFGELQPTPRKWCRAPQKIAEVGDILISVRAPVGPTNLAREKCCIGRGLAALRPKGPVETMWLLYHLRSVEDELATRGSGSTFNAITKRQLGNLEIPLPPLSEQRRIVARLEAVWERVQALKQVQEETAAHLNDLERSILDKAFRGEL